MQKDDLRRNRHVRQFDRAAISMLLSGLAVGVAGNMVGHAIQDHRWFDVTTGSVVVLLVVSANFVRR